MQLEQFNILLRKALNELYIKDEALLERRFNVNERAITHRLALHLTSLFADYDVDCEYNRMILNCFGDYTEGDYWAKSVNIPVEGPISAEDDEAKTVFPDIIIHKRKQLVNLAILEVKIKWKNGKKGFDYKKLKAYKASLKYEFAVYLELGDNLNSVIIDYI